MEDKIYYKGELFFIDDNKRRIFVREIGKKVDGIDLMYNHNFQSSSTLSSILKYLNTSTKSRIIDSNDSYLYKSLNDFFESEIRHDMNKAGKASIIGELIKDDDGNMYLKELHTNLIFPVGEISVYYQIAKKLDYDSNYIYIAYGTLFLEPINSMERLCVIANEVNVASKNEVEKYLKSFAFFGKKHFTEKITKLYKENVFNGEIKMQQEKELQSPSVGATTIEEIEYYLNILKKIIQIVMIL